MKAIYAGSFDPFTIGHLDIYNQAKEIFDEVIVLIAQNQNKSKYFKEENMLISISKIIGTNCVVLNNGLVADYCKKMIFII